MCERWEWVIQFELETLPFEISIEAPQKLASLDLVWRKGK